jgi:NADH-quinone oxidoreductase E subunit
MDQAPARVLGVVSFYTLYNMKPVGRHHIQVCRTLPCALRGAENVTRLLKKKLGIEPGQTTADGRFTLSEVECLASCGTAPMMQVNDDYYENLTEEKIDEILDGMK